MNATGLKRKTDIDAYVSKVARMGETAGWVPGAPFLCKATVRPFLENAVRAIHEGQLARVSEKP